MSSHYHLVVYVDQGDGKSLSKEEVYGRWIQLFRAPPIVERWRNGTALESEREIAEFIIKKWRARLSDLSMVHALKTAPCVSSVSIIRKAERLYS